MWIKCPSPENLGEQRFVYSDTAQKLCLLPGEDTIFLGYAKGSHAVLQFRKKQLNRPIAPKGSEGEEEQEDCTPTLNWNEVQKKLKKSGWTQGPLEWWKCTKSTTRPPKFVRRKGFCVKAGESGLEALDRMGVFTFTIPAHTTPWEKQSTLVRRYWRCLFIYLSGLAPGVHFPRYDISRAFDYICESVPKMWQPARKPHVFVPCMRFAPCQMGFFARLFNLAVKLQREGLRSIYSPDQFRLCRDYSQRAAQYVREKYPFVRVSGMIFLTETIADRICEELWFSKDLTDTPLMFEDFNLTRVFLDHADASMTVYLLENYMPSIRYELMSVRQDGPRKTDANDVHAELASVGFRWHHYSTVKKRSKVFSGRSRPLLPLVSSDPAFREVAGENWKGIFDVNWIRYPHEATVVVPWRLQVLRLSIPALPMVSAEWPKLMELMLTCALDDNFLFAQRDWYRSTPIFVKERKKWYFNASFYDCTRHRMVSNFIAMLETAKPVNQ